MKQKRRSRPKRLRNYGPARFLAPVIGLAFLAAAVQLIARDKPNARASETPRVQIVSEDDVVLLPTPARPIARGERLSDIPIATIKWPKSRVTGEYVSDISMHSGSATLTPLPKLLPIPVSALTRGSVDNNQVTEAIPTGMRAITVRVDAESAVEGWAQSGNYVDVLLVRATKEQDGSLETRLIAENIKILSAGRSAEPIPAEQSAPKPPSTATLLTSQDDALKIKTAANLGKLTFALRGVGDQLPASATSLDQKTLFGSTKPLEPARKRYRGTAKGADGKTYVLEDDMRWLESPSESKRLVSKDSQSTTGGLEQ